MWQSCALLIYGAHFSIHGQALADSNNNNKNNNDDLTNYPVIAIPGVSGTSLLASTKKAHIPSCSDEPLSYEDSRIWVNLEALLPPRTHQQCWADTMSLEWQMPSLQILRNDDTMLPVGKGAWSHHRISYKSKNGVAVKVDDNGGAASLRPIDYLEYIGDYGVYGTHYFHVILEALRGIGYQDEKNLLGFGYDWRLPLWQTDFDKLRKLVEAQSPQKVIFLTHSLGALLVTYFLNSKVTPEWKEKHVKAFIIISGPFGGSLKPVRCVLTGYDPLAISLFHWLNITVVPDDLMRGMQRSFGSIWNLTPHPSLYGENTRIIQTLSSDSWTVQNWLSVFHGENSQSSDLGDLALKLNESQHLLDPDAVLKDPQVPTYCLWSKMSSPSTEAGLLYSTRDSILKGEEPLEYILTEGDETLQLDSLMHCMKWPSTVYGKEWTDLDHMLILRDPTVAATIAGIVKAINIHAATEGPS